MNHIPSVMTQLAKLDHLSRENKKEVVDFLNYFLEEIADQARIDLLTDDIYTAESDLESSIEGYKTIFDIWSIS